MIWLSFGIKLSPEEELIFKTTFWFIFKIYSLIILVLGYFVGFGILKSTLQTSSSGSQKEENNLRGIWS